MARPRFAGGSRMAKDWEGITGAETHFTADATAIVGSFSPDRATTVLRILGSYIIGPTSAPTAADVCAVSVGVGVVSSDALAAGAGSMPDPFGDQSFPWLYWASHPFHYASTAVVQLGPMGETRVNIDVKSMRKLKEREALVWVADYFDFNGAPPMSFVGSALRVLTAH